VKILFVHNNYRQEGGEDYVFNAEAELLEAHGHEVVRYTESNTQLDRHSMLTLATDTMWSRHAYAEVRRVVRTHRPDVMHVHNTFPLLSPSVGYAARAAGVPVVQTIHNYRLLCPNGLLFRDGHVCEDCLGHRLATPGIRHACYRRSRAATGMVAAMVATHRALGTWTNGINAFIAPTEFARQKLIAGGLPAERVIVKPHFVDHDPGCGERRGHYALFVGRLSAEKGIEIALDAWARVGELLPLKVVGDGPLGAAVRAAEQDYTGVERLGWKSRADVFALMRDAQFLVAPSVCYETFGLVIAEAFGTGLPVIASDLGSARSLIDDGRTGMLFRPRDAGELATRVEWALAHPAEMAAMGQRARHEYESRFTAERNHAMLVDIYHRVLNDATPSLTVAVPAARTRPPDTVSVTVGQQELGET
jgi:glycosyltransferase involved in cell wall biosynthesis